MFEFLETLSDVLYDSLLARIVFLALCPVLMVYLPVMYADYTIRKDLEADERRYQERRNLRHG